MCGIVGYIGFRPATPILLEGLRRLEYRGYDSAGIAVRGDQGIAIRKKAGRVQELTSLTEQQPCPGTIGIGHTRWATHGPATDVNSHPHVGGNGEVLVVHNGVIENYASLREHLMTLGYVFRSATDTEVVAHLLAHHLDEQLRLGKDPENIQTALDVVELTLARLKGTFGLGILFRDFPDVLIAARLGSPLVVGVGKGEYFLASDAGPLVGHTEEIWQMIKNATLMMLLAGCIGIPYAMSNSGLGDDFQNLLNRPKQAGTPADMGAYVAREIEKWAKVIKTAGIKPQ